jgi:uncharacterized membrane protein YoaK (UPF0700 family)
MPALHKPETVFSLRHLPSWLMLCFAAGAINGTMLLACERFVTHVTGTVTRLGIEVVHWNILLDFALVLFCFVMGAMVSGLLIQGRAARGKVPWHSVPLWVTASLTALVAVAGDAGYFGSFGGSVDEPLDFVLLSCLSFAMGLQNAAVATSTGMLVRTTHLTGPATDLGVSLAELLTHSSEQRNVAKRHAALRTGKIVAYAVGAATSAFVARKFGFLSLLMPAAVIALATILSFVRSSHDSPSATASTPSQGHRRFAPVSGAPGAAPRPNRA